MFNNKMFKPSMTVAILMVLFFSGCYKNNHVQILYTENASIREQLAAKEVRRYIYQRTGKLLEIKRTGSIPRNGKSYIVIGSKDQPIFEEPVFREIYQKIKGLSPESYFLKTISANRKKILVITGGDPSGVLFGSYELAEELGIRFYLHGDVIPDIKERFKFPELDKSGNPLFETRGIQPFHDFPEGPDWWSLEDYKAILSQLPKMKMNFIGFHTYPEGGVGPEPAVWIGLPEDIDENGNVRFSYPARHFTSISGTWGYKPKPTGDYNFGASQYFTREDFGADYMINKTPWPESPDECNELFNKVGDFFGEAFSYAQELGIKTCIGTETPLTIPLKLREHLISMGKDPENPEVMQEIYQGMFEWIKLNYPLNYYWFWTPESWTWGGNTVEQLNKTKQDIQSALNASIIIKAPFVLATCGWVLGPKEDRAMFDQFLPANSPISCINREVGFSPVEKGFVQIENRPKWAIPWLEDDPAMIIPQLWAGRMRKDAADALSYGCTGLLGIHWRTRILGPNISSLAKAAWKDFEADSNYQSAQQVKSRDLNAEDFYLDWASTNFGNEAGDSLGRLFAMLDGGSDPGKPGEKTANLPRPANWVHGPGGINPDKRPWDEVIKDYQFVDKMETFLPLVKGKGNLERFNYWLNQFKYMRAIGKLNCSLHEFNQSANKTKTVVDKEEQKQLAEEKLLPIRIRQMKILKLIYKHLLNSVSTKGGLGNIANWEQHVYDVSLKPQEKLLRELLGNELSPEAMPSKEYPGSKRIIVPTVRSVLKKGENLQIELILPGINPKEAIVFWGPMGTKKHNVLNMEHVNRSVYSAIITSELIGDDLEYYIRITTEDSGVYFFPATAPELNQTVIVIE